MKKILAALLVLALGLPALANVDVTATDLGGGHLQIKIAPTGGAAVRGVALKLTRTAGNAQIAATDDATVTQFNTMIDYAYSNAGYTIGMVGQHPLANPAAAGVLDLSTPKSEFSLCAGYLDQSGGRAGVTVDSFFDVFFDLTTNSTIGIALDTLRGGIVGDTLGTVTVQSSANVNGVVNYTLAMSAGAGGSLDADKSGSYASGTVVNIDATASAGYAFAGWTPTTNIAAPASGHTTITMNANATIVANFDLIEVVSQPTIAKTTAAPAVAGLVNGGRAETFAASGAASNKGHALEYQFTWGDGNVGTWGAATQSYTYTYAAAATYNVSVQARCIADPAIVSLASAAIAEATEPVKSTASIYADWAKFNRPNCWAYPKNCKGDADGQKQGTALAGYNYVFTNDLTILVAGYGIKEPTKGVGIGTIPNGICADFARDQQGTALAGYARVFTNDLAILVANYGIKEPTKGPGIGDCSGTGHYYYFTAP